MKPIEFLSLRRSPSDIYTAAIVLLALFAVNSTHALVIQGFDDTRSKFVNNESWGFVSGPRFADARTLLGTNFSDVRFLGIPEVTHASLKGVDVFVISPIDQELSEAEVCALTEFVNQGGALLEIRDLPTRPPLLGTAVGAANGTVSPSIVAPESPLIDGAFGVVSSLQMGFSYSYSAYGDALAIAEHNNFDPPEPDTHQPNIIQLNADPDAGRQGLAVFIGDEEIFMNGDCGGACTGKISHVPNQTFFLNIFDFLQAAPGLVTFPSNGFARVIYDNDETIFPNPERGFYHHTEAYPWDYQLLDVDTLTGYRVNEGITLLVRYFYLNDFKDGPIDDNYLANMEADFAALRSAGIKAIVRFAYTEDIEQDAEEGDGPYYHDASKETILAHIAQLEPLLRMHSDVIAVVQAGFIGAFGEWWYTDHFGESGSVSPPDDANRRDVLDALLAALPENRQVQVRMPNYKRALYGSEPLFPWEAFTNEASARIGIHNDCFLGNDSDLGTYVNADDREYLAAESQFVAVGGEMCVPADSSQLKPCSPDGLAELAQFHWSFLGIGCCPAVKFGETPRIIEIKNDEPECFAEIERRLGYRFQLTEGTFSKQARTGEAFTVHLELSNEGWAAPFNDRDVNVILRRTDDDTEFAIPLAEDPRGWQGGCTHIVHHKIPASLPTGDYRLLLHLADPATALASRPEYAIRLANHGVWEAATGYNDLGHVLSVMPPASASTEVITGTDVAVVLSDPTGASTDPVEATFATVTESGTFSLTVTEEGEPLPSGYSFGTKSIHFWIDNDAAISGDVTLTFSYHDHGFAIGQKSWLTVLHFSGGTWQQMESTVDEEAGEISAIIDDPNGQFVIAALNPYESLVPPKRLAVYYGFPSMVNGVDTDPAVEADQRLDAAAAVFNDYDIVLLGDSLQFDQTPDHVGAGAPEAQYGCEQIYHNDHDKTVEIIKRIEECDVYGYVSIGGENTVWNCDDPALPEENDPPDPLTLEEIGTRIAAWKEMGVDGIFLDEGGYDFGTTRQRQNDAIDLVHAAQLKVMINAWNPDDVFNDAVAGPVLYGSGFFAGQPSTVPMNPDGLGTHLRAGDWFMLESFQIIGGESDNPCDWMDRSERARRHSLETGVDIVTLTTNYPDQEDYPPFDQAKFDYAWWSTVLYGFEAMGWGELNFSASSNGLPFRERPDPELVGDALGFPIRFDHHPCGGTGESELSRWTGAGEVWVDTAGETGGFRLTNLAAPQCVAPPEGLVHWWPGEGQGVNLAGPPRALYQNDGIVPPESEYDSVNYTHSPTVTSGKVGQAFRLDGLNDHFAFPEDDQPSLDGTGAFSISVWIATHDTEGVIIQQRDASDSGWIGQYALSLDRVIEGEARPGRVCFATYGVHTPEKDPEAGFNVCSTVTVNDGAWHHIAAVREADGTGRLYVDGQLAGIERLAPPVDLDPDIDVFIGMNPRDDLRKLFFGGLIDELSLFENALTPSEVEAIYQAGSAGFCGPNNVTPAGTNVTVNPLDPGTATRPVGITFSQVDVAGPTFLAVSELGQSVDLAGYQKGDSSLYYTITTHAVVSGPADITIDVSGLEYGVSDRLRVLHWENDTWVDRTESVNASAGTVTARVSDPGGVYTVARATAGVVKSKQIVTPSTPVPGEGFGYELAQHGNLMAVSGFTGAPFAAMSVPGLERGHDGLIPGETTGSPHAVLFGAGGVFKVEGVTDLSALRDDPLNPLTITMEAVVEWRGPNGDQQRVLEKSGGLVTPQGGAPGIAQYNLTVTDDGEVLVELWTSDLAGQTSQVLALATPAETMQPNHTAYVAATFDGERVKIYVNPSTNAEGQVLVAAEASVEELIGGNVDLPQVLVARPSHLGIGNQIGRPRPFYGLIDEVALYNQALSPEEIAIHARHATDDASANTLYADAVARDPDGAPDERRIGHWTFFSDPLPADDEEYLGVEPSSLVKLYTRESKGWGEQPLATLPAAEISAPVPLPGDEFGEALAVVGNTVVVGARNHYSDHRGEVWIFQDTSGGSWSSFDTLTLSGLVDASKGPVPSAFSWFGDSVAIDGDTLLVGASYLKRGETLGAGAVFVFQRGESAGHGEDWVHTQTFVAPQPSENANFGLSVGIRGNVCVVGAPGEPHPSSLPTPNDPGPGAVYIFERESETAAFGDPVLLQVADGRGADLGFSVAVGDDIIVAGDPIAEAGRLPSDDPALHKQRAGAAYVAEKGDDGWGEWQWLERGTDFSEDQFFGFSVSVAGSASAGDIVVGAPGTDAFKGATFLYRKRPEGEGWLRAAKLQGANATNGDFSGAAVSLDGDSVLSGAYGGFGKAGDVIHYDLTPRHAVWVWHKTKDADGLDKFDWQDPNERQLLIERCARSGINTIYLAFYLSPNGLDGHIQPKADEGRMIWWEELADVIGQAHQTGIEVYAALGNSDYGDLWVDAGCDAAGCGENEWPFPRARYDDIMAYNQVHGEASFDGVILDVENALDPCKLLTFYEGSANYLREMSGGTLPLAVDIGAYEDAMVEAAGGIKPLFAHVLDLANLDHVVVDGYHNQVETIISIDQDEIAYASALQKFQFVVAGLETQNCSVSNSCEEVNSFYEGGQDALNRAVGAVNQHFAPEVGFGGFMVHHYPNFYLSGRQDDWPERNHGADSDGDGIFDSVDLGTGVHSFSASDVGLGGCTTITILFPGTDTGLVEIKDAEAEGDGLHIIGGAGLTILDHCTGSITTLDEPSEIIGTCGSIQIEVATGSVSLGFRLKEGRRGTAAISSGNRFRFDPHTSAFEASADNASNVGVDFAEPFADVTVTPGESIHVPNNRPPQADAGSDFVAECQTHTASIVLDGSSSHDPDGENDIVSYVWRIGNEVFAEGVTPAVALEEGHYLISLTVTDRLGRTDGDIVVAHIVDTTPPEMTLADEELVIVEWGDMYHEPGALAMDACEGDVSDLVSIDDSALDLSLLDEYAVVYTARDGKGNLAELTRTVKVVDTTPPVITLLGQAEVTLLRGDAYEEAGATAVDTRDGPVAVLLGGDEVDTSTAGVYRVTYHAVDSAGNNATPAERLVNVLPRFSAFDAIFGWLTVTIGIDNVVQGSVGAGHDVFVRDRAEISGNLVAVHGEVDVQKNAVLIGDVLAAGNATLDMGALISGNLISGGDVHLKTSTHIEGDVRFAGNLKVIGDASIGGSATPHDDPIGFPSVPLPVIAIAPPGSSVKVQRDLSIFLPPGDYGALIVEQDATLQLASGAYHFTQITVKNSARIEVNAMEGIILVTVGSDVRFGDAVEMSVETSDEHGARDFIVQLSDGSVSFGRDGAYLGTFLAPRGTVDVGRDTWIEGALYGEKVALDAGVELKGNPALFGLLEAAPGWLDY